MIVTIKTKDWTVIVHDAGTKQWFYEVKRGNPTLMQVVYCLHHMGK